MQKLKQTSKKLVFCQFISSHLRLHLLTFIILLCQRFSKFMSEAESQPSLSQLPQNTTFQLPIEHFRLASSLDQDQNCYLEPSFFNLSKTQYVQEGESLSEHEDESRAQILSLGSRKKIDKKKQFHGSSSISVESRQKSKHQERQNLIKSLEQQLEFLKKQSKEWDQYDNRDIKKKQLSSSNNDEDKKTIDLDTEVEPKRIIDKGDSSLNIDLVKRQIKRQNKLDAERLRRQKQEMHELLQYQPRRKKTQKHQKRQLIISKKTLELLALKFDEYYAYENDQDYKGPKLVMRDIGVIFNIGPNTIHKLYTQWMDDPKFYDRIVSYDLNKRGVQRKLTLERLEHVARLIKENPFLTQSQLCVELNKIEDLKSMKDGKRVQITKTTVSRLLKVGKFRKKRVRCVPKQKNTAKQCEKRYEFSAKYKQLLDKQAKIYFLDESGFNLYMTRQKAWSRPNEQITVNCPISKGKRFSLIAIIGQEGLANWRIIEGTYRKYEYLDFIRQLFQKLYELNEEQHRQKWLILDNCAIHDKEETMKLADRWNVKVMYLPAYSPQLNPIEMWFHEIKTKIRKINYSGEKQLLQIMQRTLKEYQNHDFTNYYHGTLKFIEKALRREKF